MPTRPKKGYVGLIPMEGLVARWYAKNTGKDLEQFREAAQQVAAELPEGGRVLEVAPGPGYFAIELAQLGAYEVVGLDISRTFVAMAAQNAKEAGVDVTFHEGNVADMPFEPGTFDFIFCRAAFKNFSEPVQAIAEMHRVLKPGGKVLIKDLRKDASREDIIAAVDEMHLSRANSRLTKWIFKHMLLKRAYSQDDFRHMATQTPFQTCEIRPDMIGLEVWLTK